MKRINILKTVLVAAALVAGTTSCEDFLDRPDKANYTLSDFYKTDEQCLQAVNLLYTVPWFDFFRGWLRVGDCQSGNYFVGTSNGFWLLTPKNGSVDNELASMSASLWAVNARANTALENIDLYAGEGTTETGRNTAKGEAMVWKAMAYFYMVRIYGAVPIVHNNSELLATEEYNTLYRAKVENVYDYIVMTLKQAIEWLPEKAQQRGRIDKYSACGLLAKVYLTKSGYGRNGDRNQDDLDNAKEYARKVVRESGRVLTPEYADIFRGSHNTDDESLLAWRWIAANPDGYWTASNDLQSDLGMKGFTDASEPWGDWTGPSLDLQEAFGETITPDNSAPTGAFSPNRQNADKRRKATMMMYGDTYEYFWRDHPSVSPESDGDPVAFPNGFDWAKFCEQVQGGFRSPTGANCVKHLVGRNADHAAEMGGPIIGRQTSLATHILRLADVYLVYAEAILGNEASTSDPEALYAFNEIRKRAGVPEEPSITFDDIFKERRLELAFEGDFWYDFVRLSYYKPDEALAKLNAQNRRTYTGLEDYYEDKGWDNWDGSTWPKADGDKVLPRINEDEPDGKPYTTDKFTMPFPETDLQMNPNLMKEPIEYDLSQFTY